MIKIECNISDMRAGFSAKGACPASSILSTLCFLRTCLNRSVCSIGIKLSFLPHMTNVGISSIDFTLDKSICVVVYFHKLIQKHVLLLVS